jgi:hypothetical protein
VFRRDFFQGLGKKFGKVMFQGGNSCVKPTF